MSGGNRMVHVVAPGRVNLIGDHTDYTGGLVLPMAINLQTTVRASFDPGAVTLVSREEAEAATFALPVARSSIATMHPAWARYAAAVAHVIGAKHGLEGTVSTTVPVGAGLSSSAAFEVALGLALGFEGTPTELAIACRTAEHLATGVPTGIMDQLISAAGVAGHALLIDCHILSITPVPVPTDVDVVIVHSEQPRTLAGSAYGDRARECAAAEERIGPLRLADLAAVASIDETVLRHRARHVVTENQRVREFGLALRTGDWATAGTAMFESHESLRLDFETSIPAVDELVRALMDTPGVHGARMTGGGFGGCIVAITEPGVLAGGWPGHRTWTVSAAAGAHHVLDEERA
jgi:galactokinase